MLMWVPRRKILNLSQCQLSNLIFGQVCANGWSKKVIVDDLIQLYFALMMRKCFLALLTLSFFRLMALFKCHWLNEGVLRNVAWIAMILLSSLSVKKSSGCILLQKFPLLHILKNLLKTPIETSWPHRCQPGRKSMQLESWHPSPTTSARIAPAFERLTCSLSQ